jgi:hypothetical protein
MEQEIDHSRLLAGIGEQPVEQLRHARPHAGKRGERGKERIEGRRAHPA